MRRKVAEFGRGCERGRPGASYFLHLLMHFACSLGHPFLACAFRLQVLRHLVCAASQFLGQVPTVDVESEFVGPVPANATEPVNRPNAAAIAMIVFIDVCSS